VSKRTSPSRLTDAAQALAKRAAKLSFGAPVAYVYNPLEYAWPVARAYLETFGAEPKDIVFVGMNPGPFGMAQTGVPFGEIAAVRDWMRLEGAVKAPPRTHPKRPVLGFSCTRSEVSGKRLWGAFSARFPRARDFFERAFVLNYCPLMFVDEGGANVTPDKLRATERAALEEICDEHLRVALETLRPRHAVGVGQYAAARLARVFEGDARAPKVSSIPHPSPASPAANRGWDGLARAALREAGIDGVL
jgi:single-strand selective monofunctional uracil DNA glycosylase